MVPFDNRFLERSEHLKGTRRAEAAVVLLRNSLLLAAQRDQRHLDALRSRIARSPLLFAALQSDRLDPLLVASVAGDGFMRDVAGHGPRPGQPRQLTAFDLIARDALTRHIERCSNNPDVAARLQARWSSNRSCIRDGYLRAPLTALERTYGAACQAVIDTRAGLTPLHAPAVGWRPGPLAAALADPLRDPGVAAALRRAPRVYAASPEWIPPAAVRNVRRWWRHRWQAGGGSRAQQLERRSVLRVPASRWLFRRGMRRALEAGPEATAKYLRRVAANPRRVAAARAEGLDPLVVAAALGPAALRLHLSGRAPEGPTNLHGLYTSLSDVRREHLSRCAAAARSAGGRSDAQVFSDGWMTPADVEFGGLYDNALAPQLAAAGIRVPDIGLATRTRQLEFSWVAHHAPGHEGPVPSLAWRDYPDYQDLGAPVDSRPAGDPPAPAEMSLQDLLDQDVLGHQAGVPSSTPLGHDLSPEVTADFSPPRVSDPRPVVVDGRRMLVVDVPALLAAQPSSDDDEPSMTLNPDGSYTVHDRPPVERVVPQPDGSYQVLLADAVVPERARNSASAAEHDGRHRGPRSSDTVAGDVADPVPSVASPDPAAPPADVSVDAELEERFSATLPAGRPPVGDTPAGPAGTSRGYSFPVTRLVPADLVQPGAYAPEDAARFRLESDGSWKVLGDPQVDRVRPCQDGAMAVLFHRGVGLSDDVTLWAAGQVRARMDATRQPGVPSPPQSRGAPAARSSDPPPTREAVELDLAARYGNRLAEHLRGLDSMLDAVEASADTVPAVRVTDPVILGVDDAVRLGGPAALQVADYVDTVAPDPAAQRRSALVTADLLSDLGVEPPCEPVRVPDPWGTARVVALYPAARLPADVLPALPAGPKEPSYRLDAPGAPTLQHYFAGAARAAGVQEVQQVAAANPDARPWFRPSSKNRRMALYTPDGIAKRMGRVATTTVAEAVDEASGQVPPVDPARRAVRERVVCESRNLRVVADAVASTLPGPPLPDSDRRLAAHLAALHLARRAGLPYVPEAPGGPVSRHPEGHRAQWVRAAADPPRMQRILGAAARVTDDLIRHAFAERALQPDLGRASQPAAERPDPQVPGRSRDDRGPVVRR